MSPFQAERFIVSHPHQPAAIPKHAMTSFRARSDRIAKRPSIRNNNETFYPIHSVTTMPTTNAVPPNTMSPDARIEEVAALLARAFIRLKSSPIPASELPDLSSEVDLDKPPHSSVHVYGVSTSVSTR